MAAKIKIARLARDARPADRPSAPRPPDKLSGLYLLALRSRVAHAQQLVPGRKLVIPIEPPGSAETAPEPVDITHT
jgi:hypothetical protein